MLGISALTASPVLAGEPRSLGVRDALAPVVGRTAPDVIPGQYIVVFKKSARAVDLRAAERVSSELGARVGVRYTAALRGFSAMLSPAALASLRGDSRVAWIEADSRVRLSDTQTGATRGIDRIDQRNLPRNGTYIYNATGAGVKVYIIDTGIRLTHSQFGERAISGYDAINGGSADDCDGHGTHVAGTVGGSTYGVAKSVQLVAVRVLNCQGSGTNSQVIAGVDWVTADHAAGQPAVANMSLAKSASSALDTAVNNSINDGVTYAIAAGNSNATACKYSPARVAAAITVGSTTATDARSSFSNYGTCLDLFAPGSKITSAWNTSDSATNRISGTSMATPHVAGVAALYLQGSPSASPATVRDAIVFNATSGVVTSAGSGSPNLLLYSLFGGSPPPPPPPPPTGCQGFPENYSGSLIGAGEYDHYPNGTYFYTANSGTHRGCLSWPDGGRLQPLPLEVGRVVVVDRRSGHQLGAGRERYV